MKSQYEWDDIFKLRLNDAAYSHFAKAVFTAHSIKPYLSYGDESAEDLTKEDYECAMLNTVERAAYNKRKLRHAYKIAKTPRERAIAVLQSVDEDFKADFLALWAKAADSMSRLEKLLEGWNDV